VTTEKRTYHALIVEDVKDLAGVMELSLQRIGFSTHHASDGPEALTYLQETTPDIMLLDIGLPGMSGWEVLEKIKEDEVVFPIIVLTAFNDPANRLIGKLHKYVTRYVTKPFEVETLRKVVREVLAIES
jgi:CheY-like chemotaxis protein